jgi:hypothetical protein
MKTGQPDAKDAKKSMSSAVSVRTRRTNNSWLFFCVLRETLASFASGIEKATPP